MEEFPELLETEHDIFSVCVGAFFCWEGDYSFQEHEWYQKKQKKTLLNQNVKLN